MSLYGTGEENNENTKDTQGNGIVERTDLIEVVPGIEEGVRSQLPQVVSYASEVNSPSLWT